MIDFKSIEAVDPELCGAMRKELTRQREHLELIASENFVSDAVLAAMGSQSMRMCSRILAHRPTWLSILPCLNRAIR